MLMTRMCGRVGDCHRLLFSLREERKRLKIDRLEHQKSVIAIKYMKCAIQMYRIAVLGGRLFGCLPDMIGVDFDAMPLLVFTIFETIESNRFSLQCSKLIMFIWKTICSIFLSTFCFERERTRQLSHPFFS